MTTTTREITLNAQQQEAVELARNWFQNFDPEDKPVFVLSGYAGTGKTTLVKQLVKSLDVRARFMAYTGKAALVLRRYNGVPATTIHSAIYKPVVVPDETFKMLYEKRDAATDAETRRAIENEIKDLQQPRFTINAEAFSDEAGRACDLIVLDECSMVDEEIAADLKSFGIPIIALGDPGQLPPVKGEGALFKGQPDYLLTDIQRQAKDNPIIEWSMWARQGRPFPRIAQPDSRVRCFADTAISQDELDQMFLDNDMVIVWRNKTLQSVNMRIRKLKGLYQDSPYPVEGDTLVIRQNNRDLGVFNGMFCEVKEILSFTAVGIEMKVLPETYEADAEPLTISVLQACFDEYEKGKDVWEGLKPWDYKGQLKADYGYALTCHRAQGSQFPKILVIDDRVLSWPKAREDRKRWMYTAVTRASERLQVVAS